MKVLTIGTFDLLHRGHIALLRRAAENGELHVGVNSDAFVNAYKGRPPVMSAGERIELLLACKYVHDATLHDGDTAKYIEKTRAKLIVIGSDWLERDYLTQLGVTEEWLNKRGISVLFVPYTQGISTSRIIGRAAAACIVGRGDLHVLSTAGKHTGDPASSLNLRLAGAL